MFQSGLSRRLHKNLDVILGLGVFLVSIGVAGFYLFENPQWLRRMTNDSYESEASRARSFSVWVGSAMRQKGNIRFRFGNSAVWRELENDSEKVNLGDALFTAQDGQALLRFQGGEQVEVMGNTLVIMKHERTASREEPSERPPLELKHGRLKVALHRGDTKPVSVEVQGKRYEIQPAQTSTVQNTNTPEKEETVEIVASEDPQKATPELKSSIPLQVQVIDETKAAAPVAPAVSAIAPVKVEPASVSLVLAPGESFSSKMKEIQPERIPPEPSVSKVDFMAISTNEVQPSNQRLQASTRKPASELTPRKTRPPKPLTLSHADQDKIEVMQGITPPPPRCVAA